ncbi:MAG TPA: RNA 2',3'-cyclic phosphodiesterase [Synergistaceae bacterium]|nr:RNA 2',3'-cyclic phosphodiesterase [Synergistaceae bacterium]
MPLFSGVLLRTFVCITIPKPQLKILSDWLSARRRESHEFRWAYPETMHITLKFCGERPSETVDMLLSNLKNIRTTGPFDINIEGIGGFPDLVRPRVAWVGVRGDSERLIAIRNEVEKAALKASIPKENKKYTPHITIGRRNSDLPLPEKILSSMESEALVTEPWTVREITLMRSELSPRGPRHTPLGLFKI